MPTRARRRPRSTASSAFRRIVSSPSAITYSFSRQGGAAAPSVRTPAGTWPSRVESRGSPRRPRAAVPPGSGGRARRGSPATPRRCRAVREAGPPAGAVLEPQSPPHRHRPRPGGGDGFRGASGGTPPGWRYGTPRDETAPGRRATPASARSRSASPGRRPARRRHPRAVRRTGTAAAARCEAASPAPDDRRLAREQPAVRLRWMSASAGRGSHVTFAPVRGGVSPAYKSRDVVKRFERLLAPRHLDHEQVAPPLRAPEPDEVFPRQVAIALGQVVV